jgi:signal transduction histidine kinase/Tfp pilus assembly protein PilF
MRLTLSYIISLLFFSSIQAQYSPTDADSILAYRTILDSPKSYPIDDVFNAYVDLAEVHFGYNSADAFARIDSAEKLLKKTNRMDLFPRINSARGSFYASQGQFLKALQEYQHGIFTYSEKGEDDIHIAYLHVSIGNIFYKLGQYRDARRFYVKANEFFTTIGGNKGHEGEAVATNNNGLCHLRFGEANLALRDFKKAMEIRRELNKNYLVTHSYTHLMDVYLKTSQLQRADSLVVFSKTDAAIDTTSIWYKHFQMQKVLLNIKQNRLTEASIGLKAFNRLDFGSDFEFFKPYILQVRAELEISQKKYSLAKKTIDSGYSQAFTVRDFPAALQFSELGKALSIKQNNIKDALGYADNMEQVRDSIAVLSEGVVSELVEISMAFAIAKNENRELLSASEDYYARIKGQNWLLFGAFIVIMVLLVMFWYINKLSARQRKTQRNQRELNQRILAVVNNTDSHILSLNEEGIIRMINQSAIEFFANWVENDIKAGDNLFEKIKNLEVRKIWTAWFDKSKEQAGWKEVSQIRIKGKTYYYLENFSTIKKDNGEFAGLVMVGNDITKEHEFSVEIAEQRDHLERSNKAKEKMLSILAHDLKDAVYSARSLSEMVTETPDQFPKEELIHLFGLLYNNFDRTKNLLDGLLDWMRTQTGGMEAKPSAFDLSELIQEANLECEEKAAVKGVSIIVHPPESAIVYADREMIKTVLRNLISNAVKYTQPDVGKITLNAYLRDDTIEIHVKDNGTGISKEDQHKLFQFGGRFSTPGTNNEIGTGFGLSLCKELLKLNKSSLHLESQITRGSDFYFSLPLVNKNERALKHTH